MVFRPVGWVSLNVKFLDNFGQIYLMSLHKLDLYNHYSPSLLIKTCIFINSLFISLLFHLSIEKGGSKDWVLRQGDACNSAPKWPNDLKYCMRELMWVTIEFWSSQGGVTSIKANHNAPLSFNFWSTFGNFYENFCAF